jgi:hypothetical protein
LVAVVLGQLAAAAHHQAQAVLEVLVEAAVVAGEAGGEVGDLGRRIAALEHAGHGSAHGAAGAARRRCRRLHQRRGGAHADHARARVDVEARVLHQILE